MKYFYLLLHRLAFYYHVWIDIVYTFLFGNDSQGVIMQSGELVVTGKDKIEILLGHHRPHKVHVKFKGGHNHVPCNPQHCDELMAQIKHHHLYHHEHHNEYVLAISWHVTDVRTIEWFVHY